eukprot:3213240-Rhodomonas_salina.1
MCACERAHSRDPTQRASGGHKGEGRGAHGAEAAARVMPPAHSVQPPSQRSHPQACSHPLRGQSLLLGFGTESPGTRRGMGGRASEGESMRKHEEEEEDGETEETDRKDGGGG